MDLRYVTAEAGRHARYGIHAARREIAALAGSAGRIRRPGRERGLLIQAGKSAGAALLAWVVATYLLDSPVALMAPWVALVLVQATVYRSVLYGLQQLVAIALGAVLALGVQLIVGNTLIALAIALPVMLVLGLWRHLGAQGVYGATTVLFVLAYGPLGWGGVLDRLAMAGLGAAIGIAVNAFVYPPVLLRRSRTWVQSIGADLHDLLTDMSTGMAGAFGYDQARTWHAQVDHLDRSLEGLRSTLSWGRESLTLNPLRRRYVPTEPEQSHQLVASNFERLIDHLADITRTLVDDWHLTRAIVGEQEEERTDVTTLLPYGVFLREVAAGVDAYSRRVTAALPQHEATARLEESHRCAEAAFDRFRERIRTSSGQERSAVLGSLLLAGHRVLVDLGEMLSSTGSEELTR